MPGREIVFSEIFGVDELPILLRLSFDSGSSFLIKKNRRRKFLSSTMVWGYAYLGVVIQ